jgi:predicted homoserine dehydrogenase-like protein
MNIFIDLERRERRLGRPLQVAVIGAGFLGGGLVRRLSKIKGMCPAIVANRTVEKARRVLEEAGAAPDRIVRADDPDAASRALERGSSVVTAELCLPAAVDGIDAVMEATGTMHVGTEVALECFRRRKHIIEANPEVQVTVGAYLKGRADEAGVVYSDIDGDQPGIIMNLYNYASGLGLAPVVAGNCKGVMKRYATPETQAAFARSAGISPWIATAAADGTKLNLEMAAVANATGMKPARTGMVGPETSLDGLLAELGRSGLLDGPPVVEYTLGIPSGVFVVARSDDPHLQREFRYLKMGDGPNYLFYRPYVLCQFEAPLTAAEAVLYGTATLTPASGPPATDVATFAKRDLRAGEPLGGIGGPNHYGLIMDARAAADENALPVGLAEYAELRRDIAKDSPIRRDDVVLDERPAAVRLRMEQDAQFAARPVTP